MTTSTIRFVLIAALFLGGIVVINQAFPDGASAGGGVAPPPNGGVGTTNPSTGATGTTATGATGTTTGQPADLPSPQIDGVLIAVFNTTEVSGLAQELNDELVAEGYVEAQEPSDASLSPNSLIYYRTANDQADAEYIANTYFKKLDVVPSKLEPGNDVDRDVQIAIYIGNDYASRQPSN